MPIENKVESRVGKVGVKVDGKSFRQHCRDYAASQVDAQRQQFVRLGVVADWSHPYLTMDYQTEADTMRALGKLVDNGHLVQGYKPVYWSVVGGSALAEAEVEYQDKESTWLDVCYESCDQKTLLAAFDLEEEGEGRVAVVIWTTTAWTLPASQAVCLGPGLDYALVQCELPEGPMRLVLAESLVDETMTRCAAQSYRIIGRAKGSDLEHQLVRHPFYQSQLPVILGEHVTLEAGTGAVHTAPDHGVDDFAVGRRYGLETLDLIDDNGLFRQGVGLFAGQHVYKVGDSVIATLKEHNALLASGTLTHSYPHCWRTKSPLILRATPQWFVSMGKQGLLVRAVEELAAVRFTPERGRKRMLSMLEQSPDWCVSRQRSWGVPLPLFVDKNSGDLHPETAALIEQVALRVEKEGIDAWFDMVPADLLAQGEDERYTKVSDTLDVWFESGVTHTTVCERRSGLHSPADLYLEGSDQHRGWFQSSLKTSVGLYGQAPFRELVTHGFTVDAKGRKMSKSLGNVVPPSQVVDTLGADILRLWVASTDYTSEMTVSDQILRHAADSYRRIRNTARFLLSNLNGFTPENDGVAHDAMLQLDRWVIDRTLQLQNEIVQDYQNYHFSGVIQKVHNFCALELGGFYLDIIKDRQYTTPADSTARRSCQTAMCAILEAFVRWIAPIVSFTADEIWQAMPGQRSVSVHMEQRYTGLSGLREDDVSSSCWSQIIAVKSAVNGVLERARNEGLIGGSLQAEVTLFVTAEIAEQLAFLGDELRFVLITSKASVADLSAAPAAAMSTETEGLSVLVERSEAERCARCWHHSAQVGSESQWPELCPRCVENVQGAGEVRRFA